MTTQTMSSENLHQGSQLTLDTIHESSYGYLSTLLVALVSGKYQASNSDPLQEHGTIMLLFLIVTFTYVISLNELKLTTQNNRRSPILRVICHVSGILANELLLLILVNPLHCFIINVAAILLVQSLCYCYLHVSTLLNLVGISFKWLWCFSRKVENQNAEVQKVEL